MTKFSRSLLAACCGLIPAATGQAETIPPAVAPPTILWNGAHLADIKDGWSKGNQKFAKEITAVVKAADEELTHEPYTIVTQTRPAGTNYDPHDYYSMGPYWWPNPNTSDGLPFVRRDGEVNPKSAYCREDLGAFVKAVRYLALAGYITGDDKYTARAVLFIKAWFLDEKTRMNPNLNYAQAIPGRSEGRGIGLIDTAILRELIDAMQVLSLSPSWPDEDRKRVKVWFDAFLHWFLESKAGKEEAAQPNNHGTWYRQQVALYAVFAGQEELARPFFGESLVKLIESQIEEGGRQPKELARTRAMSYCLFNLQAWEDIATLSPRYGQDYWNPSTPVGKRLKAGIDFMVPYADPTSIWMQEKVERNNYWSVLTQAASHYGDKNYAEALAKLPEPTDSLTWQRLVYTERPQPAQKR